MKKDPIGTLCRLRMADFEEQKAQDLLYVSERNYLIRELVVRDNQLAVQKLELARLRRAKGAADGSQGSGDRGTARLGVLTSKEPHSKG